MTQKAITKLNGNTIGFVIILFVVTSVGSLSTEDSLSNEEGFLTTIGDDLSIAEETEGYTVTSVASPYARVSEEIKDSVVTASRPRKVDSLPAFVAKPSILQAFSSRLGEPEQIPDTDTQERSGGFRRGKGCQQYLLQVRKELHCTATPHFEQFGSFDARLRAQDASTQAQHERLESIEKTMRNFQTSIDALGQRFSHLNVQRDDETYDAGFDTASREASTILISMTQQLQQRLLVMGRKIEESERQRSVLVESSKNLSALLQQSQKLVETLTEEKNQHEANSSKLQVELTQSKHNISMLTNVKNKMLKKIVSLRNCQICKNTNRRCFKQCKNEMKKQMSARRQCQLRLQNITVTLSLLTSELTRLKEIKSSQEKTSSTDDGKKITAK